jgi:hypothetical protein
MVVSFKMDYRNKLIDKKDYYPIPRPPSWDDRNYSYGHQLYPSDYTRKKKKKIKSDSHETWKCAVFPMERALTSHGSSKSNKKTSDGRGISD